jgi:hypothetical protein
MISENVIENVRRGKEIESLGYTFLTPKQNSLLTEYINKVIKKRNVKQLIIKKKKERDNLKVKLKKEKGDNKTELITVRLRAIEEATKEIDNLNEEYESVKFVQFNNKERQALFRIKQKISDFLGKTTEIKEISIILDLLEQNP